MSVKPLTGPLYKKVVVIGDPACGKSCLLSVFFHGTYPRFFVPPKLDKITWKTHTEGKEVYVKFLDTMGNDGPNSNRPYAYLDADAVMICYNVGSVITLENIRKKWLPEISGYLKDHPIILVGLKKDLRRDIMYFRELRHAEDRMCRIEDCKDLAQSIGAIAHFECSAKTGEDLRQVFVMVAKIVSGHTKSSKTERSVTCSLL